MQAERRVAERAEELGRVDGAGLHGGEDLAGRNRDDGGPGAAEHLAAQAGGAEAQAAEVIDAAQLAAEPAHPLRAAVAGIERLHAEAAVDLIIQRLAAAVHHPRLAFPYRHAEREAAEESDTGRLGDPERRHAVVKVRGARRDRVERARCRHHLAGGEQAHSDATAGDGDDPVRHFLGGDTRPRQVARP